MAKFNEEIEKLYNVGLITDEEKQQLTHIVGEVIKRVQENDLEDAYVKILEDLNADSCVVLDLGDAYLAKADRILKKYPNISLVVNDIFEYALNECFQRLDGILKDRVTLLPGDATKLNLQDQSVDRVAAFFVLNKWKGNFTDALRECKRVLKPGGMVIVSEYHLNSNLEKDQVYKEIFGDFHGRSVPMEECKQMAAEAGFTVQKDFENNHCWYLVLV